MRVSSVADKGSGVEGAVAGGAIAAPRSLSTHPGGHPKPAQAERKVGKPCGQPGGKVAARAKCQTHLLEDEIGETNEDAGGDTDKDIPPAKSGAERDRNEHHHQASPGRGQPALKFSMEPRRAFGSGEIRV